jgi:hypothetical protein
MREFQRSATESPSTAPAALRAAVPPAAAQVLALQRSVGNRATAQLLARCPGCGDRCKDEESLETEDPRRRPKRLLSRVPAYRPDLSQWPSKDNPWPDCTEFQEHEGISAWKFWTRVGAPDRLAERCGCSLVGDAFRDYLNAVGGRRAYLDDNNCISEQCAKDDKAHEALERSTLKKWHDQGPVAEAALTSGRTAELDLVQAMDGNFLGPQRVPFVLDATLDITFRNNKLAGGLLFGGGAPPGETSSDFGRDTRLMSGTIRLERTDHGENPNFIDVRETVVFNYTVDDALDFCPGNTNRLTGAGLEGMAYNEFLSDMSRLEASGMTKDIGFYVEYHRTHTEERSIRRTLNKTGLLLDDVPDDDRYVVADADQHPDDAARG